MSIRSQKSAGAAGRLVPNAPRLSLAIQIEETAGACPVDRAQLRRWVRAALQPATTHTARLTLRLVGKAEARALNEQFRGRDYVPNVLTFVYDDEPGILAMEPETLSPRPSARTALVQADIVVCLPVVRSQARAQSKPLQHHLAHLVIHGTLHAQGHDHETEIEAHTMEALETRLLRRFRIPDPYADARTRALLV